MDPWKGGMWPVCRQLMAVIDRQAISGFRIEIASSLRSSQRQVWVIAIGVPEGRKSAISISTITRILIQLRKNSR
jgi:hypothetical protein